MDTFERFQKIIDAVPKARPNDEITLPQPSWIEREVVQVAGPNVWDQSEVQWAERNRNGTSSGPILQGDATTAEIDEALGSIADSPFSGLPDDLAWYHPFHFMNQSSGRFRAWGVYIRASGIEQLARVFAAGGLDWFESTKYAKKFLLDHEMSHFACEMKSSELELAGGLDFYARTFKGSKTILAEEALANYQAIRAQRGLARDIAADWCSRAPAGYSDWGTYAGRRDEVNWAEVMNELMDAAQLGGCPVDDNLQSTSQFAHPPVITNLKKFVPVYLVLDGHGVNGGVYASLTGPVLVLTAKEFDKDLEKLRDGRLALEWQKTLVKLENGQIRGGTNLKQVKNLANGWSARINKQWRAGLVHLNGIWVAAVVTSEHDATYDVMKRRDILGIAMRAIETRSGAL